MHTEKTGVKSLLCFNSVCIRNCLLCKVKCYNSEICACVFLLFYLHFCFYYVILFVVHLTVRLLPRILHIYALHHNNTLCTVLLLDTDPISFAISNIVGQRKCGHSDRPLNTIKKILATIHTHFYKRGYFRTVFIISQSCLNCLLCFCSLKQLFLNWTYCNISDSLVHFFFSNENHWCHLIFLKGFQFVNHLWCASLDN